MSPFERAIAKLVRGLPAEQVLALVRARLVELGVIAAPRPTEALRRELARRRKAPLRRRPPPLLEDDAPPERPRVLFRHDPVFGLPIFVPTPESTPPAPAEPAGVLRYPNGVEAVCFSAQPADIPTPADSGVRLKRVHRAEVVQALVKRAAVEVVEAKRPTVVPCAWCGKLVAVKPHGPIVRHCRAPAPCSWRAHDAKFKSAVDARRLEISSAPPPSPPPTPAPLSLPPESPAVASAADSRAARVVRLFGLVSGPGERRSECRRYSDCLAGFVRGRGASLTAHCPSDCRGFEPIPRHAELELASTGGTSALAEVSQTRRERAHDAKTSRGNAGPRWARRPIDEGDDLEDDHDETG